MATYGETRPVPEPPTAPKQQKKNPLLIGIGVFLGLAVVGSLIPDTDKQVAPNNKWDELSFEEKGQLVVNKHELSMRWGCERLIKDRLRDPDSYKANKVSYNPALGTDDARAIVQINITYRAKNGFGGYVPGHFVCYVDRNGDLILYKSLS